MGSEDNLLEAMGLADCLGDELPNQGIVFLDIDIDPDVLWHNGEGIFEGGDVLTRFFSCAWFEFQVPYLGKGRLGDVQRLSILISHLIIMGDDESLVRCSPHIQFDLMDAATDGALKRNERIHRASKQPSAVSVDAAFRQVGFRYVRQFTCQ
jgi:hypothetical protein